MAPRSRCSGSGRPKSQRMLARKTRSDGLLGLPEVPRPRAASPHFAIEGVVHGRRRIQRAAMLSYHLSTHMQTFEA